jgi:DNA-binding NarL/FixJ family response regulator
MHEDPAYAQVAWRQGASAYVPKTRSLREVVTAIRAVTKGQTYLSPPFDELVALWSMERPKALSRRQREILMLRGQGQRSAEIGTTLGISPKTVSAHEEHLLHKLHLQSRHELLSYAARHVVPSTACDASRKQETLP